jgi:hypothetical protein
MAAFVAVSNGDLACPHKGKRSLSGFAKFTVGGSPVVQVTAVPGVEAYKDCTTKDTNGVAHPCLTSAAASPGTAKLTAGGKPVLLDSDKVTATNDLSAPFDITVEAGQSKLTAS